MFLRFEIAIYHIAIYANTKFLFLILIFSIFIVVLLLHFETVSFSLLTCGLNFKLNGGLNHIICLFLFRLILFMLVLLLSFSGRL